MRIHLDTDFAGDSDDACALALLLGWPEVELVGVTTTAEDGGRRAGYAAYFLELCGRGDVPVAAGAELSLTTGRPMGGIPDDERYWTGPVPPRTSRPGEALELLDRSIAGGATVVAIGPYTNLALLEDAAPGRLGASRTVVMGGWLRPPDEGLPAWGPEMDWNVQSDTRAAVTVAEAADLTLVTLAATLKAHLREAHLPRLVASGPIGALLARQARAHADDHGKRELGRSHTALPEDLLNFHYDPVACAVAAGWTGATTVDMRIRPELEGDVLRFEPDETGPLVRVVEDVDGDAFPEIWLEAVKAAQASR